MPVRKLLSCSAIAAVLAVASPALADVSSWVFVGGGSLSWKQSEYAAYSTNATMMIDVGVGSSPDAKVIGGALFRIQPVFGNGADLALLGRLCTHGYQAGDWGLAIDAGGYARGWGYQSIGFAGGASLGMPFGFTLAFQTEVGTDSTYGFGVVAGIDLLRLTVYRKILLNWWQNPAPGPQPQKTAGDGAVLRF